MSGSAVGCFKLCKCTRLVKISDSSAVCLAQWDSLLNISRSQNKKQPSFRTPFISLIYPLAPSISHYDYWALCCPSRGTFHSFFQIQTNHQAPKPLVFITCGIHAREWVSPATCMYLIEQVWKLKVVCVIIHFATSILSFHCRKRSSRFYFLTAANVAPNSQLCTRSVDFLFHIQMTAVHAFAGTRNMDSEKRAITIKNALLRKRVLQ